MKKLNLFCRPTRGRADFEHIDAVRLRDMGLNPEDFRDAAEGRHKSLLFNPFRNPRD